MANEKHDPWALLREARESMGVLVDVGWIPAEMSNVESRAVECIKRIDAALAEHDAVPPSEVGVEWRLANRPHVFLAHLNDADMALRVDWDRWYWKVTREGHTNTLDEAKAVAIAAAKGMR